MSRYVHIMSLRAVTRRSKRRQLSTNGIQLEHGQIEIVNSDIAEETDSFSNDIKWWDTYPFEQL